MTIIFDSARRVKHSRTFGRFTYPAVTDADRRWWAENSPANADGYEVIGPGWDERAEESALIDRLCSGCLPY